MTNQEIVVCVADDLGLRVWLERTLDGAWPVEFVASSDLTRVIKLVEATGCRLVFVAMDEANPTGSLRVISALVKSNPALKVVTMAKRVTQEHLLKCMRAGARDCFLADSDAEEIRDQVQVLLSRDNEDARGEGSVVSERRQGPVVTLLTGVSATVDTRFLTQSMAFAISKRYPDARLLAVDTAASERHVFYLDANNRFNLSNLLHNPDTLDETLVDTALEEYVPGLRLLAGTLPPEDLSEASNADLFIAFSQLMGLFDYLIVNVDPAVADHWIEVVGLHATRLVMAIHPIVEQAHLARDKLQQWAPELSRGCERVLLVDGFEDKVPPGLGELENAVGIKAVGALPLDWANRLLAKNAGIPIHKLPRRSVYNRKLESLMRRLDDRHAAAGESGTSRRLQRRA